MEKENKLVNKIKRLLRQIGCPRWIHHYGPKTYEFIEHFTALLIRSFCRLSYRRTKYLLDLLGIRCPSKSALHDTAKKLGLSFWQRLLKATCNQSYLIAIDSTGFSRTNPSYHYLRRIDGKMPKIPVKLSVAFDTKRKKFCAAKVRVLPSHDIKDAKALLLQSKPKVLVADKAYDARWMHELCSQLNCKAHIPVRQWGKPRFRNMGLRMKSVKKFSLRVYHRREMVESGFGSIKRKFGASVSSKSVRTIRTEIFARLVCHNIFLLIFDFQDRALCTTTFINHTYFLKDNYCRSLQPEKIAFSVQLQTVFYKGHSIKGFFATNYHRHTSLTQ